MVLKIFAWFSFVCRMESLELAADDALCGKGYELVLFLFTDILVVAKKKTSKIGGMMRSPSTASLAANQAPLQTKVRSLRENKITDGIQS